MAGERASTRARVYERIAVAPIARALADVLADHFEIVPQGRGNELRNGVTILGGKKSENADRLLFVFTDAEGFEYRMEIDARALVCQPKQTVVESLRELIDQRNCARRRRQGQTAIVLGLEVRREPKKGPSE